MNTNEAAKMVADALGQPVNHKGTARLAADLGEPERFDEFTGTCCGGDCTHSQRDELPRKAWNSANQIDAAYANATTFKKLAAACGCDETSAFILFQLAFLDGAEAVRAWCVGEAK